MLFLLYLNRHDFRKRRWALILLLVTIRSEKMCCWSIIYFRSSSKRLWTSNVWFSNTVAEEHIIMLLYLWCTFNLCVVGSTMYVVLVQSARCGLALVHWSIASQRKLVILIPYLIWTLTRSFLTEFFFLPPDPHRISSSYTFMIHFENSMTLHNIYAGTII